MFKSHSHHTTCHLFVSSHSPMSSILSFFLFLEFNLNKTAYVSIVPQQRNESCNAKEFLQDRKRMVALFEDIALYSTEMLDNRNMRNKIPLNGLLFFFQNKRDVFITMNFIPPGLDGASISSLVTACFYYSVSGKLNHTIDTLHVFTCTVIII